MRSALILALAAVLAGCGSLGEGGGPLTHHVAVSIDDKRCMAASRWGSMAVTGDINAAECRAIVEGRRARELLRLLEAQAAGQSARQVITQP